ncbi:MAG TPA: HD domain-containing protein [Candidatus Polarisedimenticolaceae bacterium]|nr:HD domain-containing protein [Candidatus Polarisedimenticolaceae bacterium]
MTETSAGLPSRDDAWRLLNQYTGKPGLLAHGLAVEAALRAYAARFDGDPAAWGIVGLLHDFDYERWPTADDHPYRGAEILQQLGYPSWFRRAILSHADYSGVTRVSRLEHALYACDELSGFLTACALVRPDRSIRTLTVESVRKKMKSKAFAAGVNRDDIIRGAAALGVELDAHIEFVRGAMSEIADRLGLDGGGGLY